MKTYEIKGSLAGVNVLVTGGNSGIGRETVKALYLAGATVYIACRSEERAIEAIERIVSEIKTQYPDKSAQLDRLKNMIFVPLDLIDTDSIKKCAEMIKVPLHLLINNAGFANPSSGPTKDNYEPILAVNHLGHFLLTMLLFPRLLEGAKESNKPSRIINVASKAHYSGTLKEEDAYGSRNTIKAYADSKLANVLFTKELAKKVQEKGLPIRTYSLHPGVVATDIWRGLPAFLQWTIKLFMISEEQGAFTTLYCATSPDLEGTEYQGKYFDDCTETKWAKIANDDEFSKGFWERSVKMLNLEGQMPI